jgi:hypothetical protein
MADRESTYDYGVLGSGITPRNLDKWANIPFYKRNVFTGVDQANSAANLMTSDSFRSYWSQGMTNPSRVPFEGLINKISGMDPLPETYTGIRVDNMNMDRIMAQRNNKRLDFLTPYKSQYGTQELIGMDEMGRPTYRYSGQKNPIYWDLANKAGAETLENRALLSVLKYRNPDESGLTRYTLANSPRDTLDLAEELRLHTTKVDTQVITPTRPAKIMFRDGWFGPAIDRANRIMDRNSILTGERLAIERADETDLKRKSNLMHKGVEDPFPDSAEPQPRPRPFAVGTNPAEERRVGKIEYTYPTKGEVMGSNQTTTIYGPPEKYAGLRTLATNATNVARTGASYGMSGLALYGAIDSGMSVPARHEAYQSAGNNWLLSQAGAQSDAMLNFMSMGAYDANRFNTGGTRGDYRGAMSARQTPAMFRGEQSVHLDPRRYVPVGMSLDDTLSSFQR